MLLLRELDLKLDITQRVAQCFTDCRDARFVEHGVPDLVRHAGVWHSAGL